MRYLALLLLNVPVIFLALINILTQYKLKRVSRSRFQRQLLLWLSLMVVLIGSFPLYNHVSGNAPFDSSELSAFDIVQTTAIIYLVYIANNHRRKIEHAEQVIRELHQETSIRLSSKNAD